jgi:RNA polymerase sigma-70 factor (ECF subfamily)
MQMPGSPKMDSMTALSVAGIRWAHPSAVEQEVIELFDRWREPLLRFLSSGCSIAFSDSEDIIQETFLALFEHLRRGKSRHNLRGWLFRVAHNLARKKYQRSRQDSKNIPQSTIALQESLIDPAPNPEDQLASDQTKRRLMAVLEALPEQNRWCLYLRAEGLRYREIAEVLDMSLGSVLLSLSRSLGRLANAVER